MNRTVRRGVWAIVAIAVASQVCFAQSTRQNRGGVPEEVAARLRTYDTPYYVVRTDLPAEKVREAEVRLKAMAEDYYERTRGFAGSIKNRLPFYLFSNSSDYHAAGGLAGSVGVYDGVRLMAVASEKYGDDVWRVVQHEGFHQFAALVIRGRLPVWVNEGLAEYFGHGIWTGDGMVTGVIPPDRMRRVQEMVRTERLLGFMEMLEMTQKEWNGTLSRRNYDQAWSMTHFLIHADGGKYRKEFGQFISDVASGRPWAAAFAMRFGRDTKAFEKRYADWWLGLPAEATPEIRPMVAIQTLNSFLARASARKQKFKDFADFITIARSGKLDLATDSDQWLPAKLLESAVAQADTIVTWSLVQSQRYPKLVLTTNDRVFTGSFEVLTGNVWNVKVTVATPAKAKPLAQPASRPQTAATTPPGKSR